MSNPEIETIRNVQRLCAWGNRVTREEVRQYHKITFLRCTDEAVLFNRCVRIPNKQKFSEVDAE